MVLKSIKLFNYRSFFGEHFLEFSENGLVLLQGISGPGESSSGVGKSSLLSAIPFVLGFGLPSTRCQNWFSEEAFYVELELTVNNQNIKIRRGAGLLRLSIDGQEVKGGKTVVESRLKELIKITPEMLEALVYRKQKERSIFFAKGDTDKKSFLSNILGL